MFALEPKGSALSIRVVGEMSKSALELLEKAHRRFLAIRKAPQDGSFWLPPREVAPLLRALSTAGRFSHQNKPLILNLFGSIGFSDGLLIRDEKVAISECDAFGKGPPHWCIYRGVFRLIDEDVEWEQLEQKPCQAEPKEVWPILQLTDRHGGFANLLMDYGELGEIDFHDAIKTPFPRLVKAEQQWQTDLLETDFRYQAVGKSYYYCPLNCVGKALTFLLELGWRVRDASGRIVRRMSEFKADVTTASGRLLVRGSLTYGETKADLTNVVGAFNRRERFVELGEGVGLLPDLPALEVLTAGAVEDDGLFFSNRRLGALSSFLELEGVKADPALREPIAVELGTAFQGELRPYQRLGVNWLAFLYAQGVNGLLADDMGLGKTVQIIAFLSRFTESFRHLIVVPTSLLFNWKREFERFLPGVPVLLHHGPDRDLGHFDREGAVYLTSYGTLRRDAKQLAEINFQCVILDEAQKIKNPDSETAKAVCMLRSAFRLSLTGTPIENRAEELWSQFRFLMPDLLGDRETFRARVQAAQVDSRHGQSIAKEIAPFFLRRTKEQVAPDLPPKIEQVVWVEMPPDQREAYERLLVRGRSIAESGSRMEVLELILRLRQVCCHPLLVDSLLDGPASSGKIETLLDDLQAERKVLVYSQFSSMLHLISKQLDEPHVMLEGKTRNREEVVRQFQEDPSIRIFLVSLMAGGTGLNLTAADTVILYDPWWNGAVEAQAIDRAHRIGQEKRILAKRYITIDSIEERIERLKAYKRSLGAELLGDNTLTDDELRSLIV